jgi:hypothetical protein
MEASVALGTRTLSLRLPVELEGAGATPEEKMEENGVAVDKADGVTALALLTPTSDEEEAAGAP